MVDYDKIKILADRAKEYERQRKELWTCYLEVDKHEQKKFTLLLKAGISEDLTVTLSNEQANTVVLNLCEWYKSEIDKIKEEISKCLTDKQEDDTM